MQSTSTTPPIGELFLTALPNGWMDRKSLRFSLLLSPSLNQQAALPALFNDWPEYAAKLKWKVTFVSGDSSRTSILSNVPATSDPQGAPRLCTKLWHEIFAGLDRVEKRKGTSHLHGTWRLSHNITRLHHRHQVHRLAHAYRQLSANAKVDLEAQLNPLHNQTAPPALFLHPEFQTNLALRYDDRTLAEGKLAAELAALSGSTDSRKIVRSRIDYSITQLEAHGDAKLSAVSLAGVYISCLQSAMNPGRPDESFTRAIRNIEGWFGSSTPFQATYPPIATVIDYVEMLLFHRRSSPEEESKVIKPPDFHQLLGLLHNHPAIMRRLGLVFDLVVDAPAPPINPCAMLVELDTVQLSKTDPKTQKLIDGLTIPKIYTQCIMESDVFAAAPRRPGDNTVRNGLLNLQAADPGEGPRFALVPENADGQALKLTDQVNHAARAVEYTSSAPTAIRTNIPQIPAGSSHVATPSATTHPLTAPPAPRTVGLALFDQHRLTRLEESIGSMAPGVTPTDFYAEDLILGYRVDVLYKQRFFPLCLRNSTYEICAPHSDRVIDKLELNQNTATTMELRASEGFVSFGATQSPLKDKGSTANPAETQTQIHHSLFTWTGWSLAVKHPGFPNMNGPESNGTADQKHLNLRPGFSLPEGSKLPPLRFNTAYKVRCRVVDLAGNSAPPDLDPNNVLFDDMTATPLTPFSRHEPIRAPQFLLVQPINRTEEPGSHIDRMVARDRDRSSSRMLVPPRETLRLAELSGALTNDKLPGTAFGSQQLLADGSFPSVGCAREKGWIDGRGKSGDPGENDPIFLRNVNYETVKNPYYPDPLANYIRIEIYQLTDNPSQSLLIDLKWLKITAGSKWPERLPARVRLIPESAQSRVRVAVDAEGQVHDGLGLSSVPTLDVRLPEAATVVLRISSAAVAPGDGTEGSEQYHVHLSHLTQLHLQRPEAFTSLVKADANKSLAKLGDSIKNIPGNPFRSPHVFVNGNLEIMTPKRSMILVHAVRRPLDAPEFAPVGSAGNLRVKRAPARAEAGISGQVRAHWLSTGKITCYAEWCDLVDDVTKSEPVKVCHREVAFVATSGDFEADVPQPANRLRKLKNNMLQHFLDTRAHDITYKLVASTNFREYYPGAGETETANDEQYQREGKNTVSLTIASSVSPLAPPVAYVIPAFVWADTYDRARKIWHAGRTVVLRVYMERPFLLSGNRETIGVVLSHTSSGVPADKQNYVSRWGADPTRPVTTPITHNELSEANLCEPGPAIEECRLAEGDLARIKPCTIQYSTERKLWYSDIPVNTQHANAPFVRLALVRWQPDALAGTTAEARCSQVVFAEFMQISPDRWVSIQKHDGSSYTITISGAFANDPSRQCFNLELQKRWYALGHDTGWRKVPPKHPVCFHYNPPDSSGVSSWTAELETPHSAYISRYRILLSELEFPDKKVPEGQRARKSFLSFVPLP